MAHFLEPLLDEPTRQFELRNAQSGAVLATRVVLAADARARRRGLLGRPSMPDGEAMVLAPCSGIHTFFMQFAIDALFLDRRGLVLALRLGLKPWRIAISPLSFAVVEMAAGQLRARASRGDHLALEIVARSTQPESRPESPG
jgi:uncharacterized membrane protein (UPF0127 family)